MMEATPSPDNTLQHDEIRELLATELGKKFANIDFNDDESFVLDEAVKEIEAYMTKREQEAKKEERNHVTNLMLEYAVEEGIHPKDAERWRSKAINKAKP